MAGPYKLLVIDIDGTLLDDTGVISDIDKQTLAEVKKAGITVSLSTGRVVQAAHRFIKHLDLEGWHVFFDGALVYNPDIDDEVYVDPIPPELVGQMIDFSYEIGLEFDLYSKDRFFAERETWATDIRRDFFLLDATLVDFRKIRETERLIKGTMVVKTDEGRQKATAFCERFENVLNFSWTTTPAFPEVNFINVVANDVSKGKALASMTAFLGIKMEEVMAIGDGLNDISLLSSAGLGVAMGNAPDKLKELADHVTSEVSKQGVTEAVRKFLL